MTDLAVSVRGLGKRYQIAHQRNRYGRLTESLSGAVRAPIERLRGKPRESVEWFWALQDVSFDLRNGEVLGIIGRNGAGKSTLLKILSRITEPTTGTAELRGRVGSLLEVGTGFHPELTGRENILMSGAVLGMRRREIERKFDEIVAFSGVEQFLDTPVKRYSSGMQVRLGFSVAAHLETDVLVVDEVLAVGDAEFQKRCLSRMGDISKHGRTVLFVSHNLAAIESLCRSAVLLDGGRVAGTGPVQDVIGQYLRSADQLQVTPIADRLDRKGSGRLRITGVSARLQTGKASVLSFQYESAEPMRTATISVGLFTVLGEGVAYLSSEMSGDTLRDLPSRGSFTCAFDAIGVLPGRYMLNVYCVADGLLADWVVDAAVVDVEEGDFFGTGQLPPAGYGSIAVVHRWTVAAR